MRRLCAAFASITLASIIALWTLNHADARGGCRYKIVVSRQETATEPSARVCGFRVVDWLGVYSGAPMSREPKGDLLDGYTITIFLQVYPLQPDRFRPLLTERVYPLAEGAPLRSCHRGPPSKGRLPTLDG